VLKPKEIRKREAKSAGRRFAALAKTMTNVDRQVSGELAIRRSIKSTHHQASEKSVMTVFQKLDKRSSHKLLLNFKTQEPREADSKDYSQAPVSFQPIASG
jgi:hypothetical protein